MQLTIPNMLTAARLVAALALPIIVAVGSSPHSHWAVAAVFLSAAASDWLDGQLARRFGWQTKAGAVLDTVADKALVASAFLAVIACLDKPDWILFPAAVILAREFLVSGLREMVGRGPSALKSTFPAKCKTALQMAGLMLLMICCAVGASQGSVLMLTGFAAIWLAALLTVITGLDYFRKALPALREDDSNG